MLPEFFIGFLKGLLCGLIPGLHTNQLVYNGISAVEGSAMVASQLVFQLIPTLLYGVPTTEVILARRSSKAAVRMALVSLIIGVMTGLIIPFFRFFVPPAALLVVFLFLFEEPHFYILSGLLNPPDLAGFFFGGFTLPYVARARGGPIQEGRAHLSLISVAAGVLAGMLAMNLPGFGTPAQMAVFAVFLRPPSFSQFAYALMGTVLGLSMRWYPKIYTLKISGVDPVAMLFSLALSAGLLILLLRSLHHLPSLRPLLPFLLVYLLSRPLPTVYSAALGFLIMLLARRRVSLMGAITFRLVFQHL